MGVDGPPPCRAATTSDVGEAASNRRDLAGTAAVPTSYSVGMSKSDRRRPCSMMLSRSTCRQVLGDVEHRPRRAGHPDAVRPLVHVVGRQTGIDGRPGHRVDRQSRAGGDGVQPSPTVRRNSHMRAAPPQPITIDRRSPRSPRTARARSRATWRVDRRRRTRRSNLADAEHRLDRRTADAEIEHPRAGRDAVVAPEPRRRAVEWNVGMTTSGPDLLFRGKRSSPNVSAEPPRLGSPSRPCRGGSCRPSTGSRPECRDGRRSRAEGQVGRVCEAIHTA